MNIRKARILQARVTGHKKLIPYLVLRECIQWTWEDFYPVRYDFAYVDPADGSFRQIGVDVAVMDLEEIERAHLVETAKSMIARMLWQKCGPRAIETATQLRLPGTVPGRYV